MLRDQRFAARRRRHAAAAHIAAAVGAIAIGAAVVGAAVVGAARRRFAELAVVVALGDAAQDDARRRLVLGRGGLELDPAAELDGAVPRYGYA